MARNKINADVQERTGPARVIRGLFRRSLSSSSSRSRASFTSFSDDHSTPRTSVDSESGNEITDSLLTVKQPPQASPFHTLPVELIQHIASYLDNASAASFCLSSRYACYAVGMNHLLTYIEASRSRFERRRMIEAVVERAFPSHWFCAWCDKFHHWIAQCGPAAAHMEFPRDCAEFNSYVCDDSDYVIYFHHVRLAVNRALWGPEHGISLSKFSHTRHSMVKILKTFRPARLHCEAKVVNGRFLLCSSYSIDLPVWSTSNKLLLGQLWPTLPHILVGHRNSDNGHTGLMAAIDNVVRRGWKYPFAQMCSTCATDWTVYTHEPFYPANASTRLVIQTWRDLGTGRNPFDVGWRAHGVPVHSPSPRPSIDTIRVTQVQAGEIKRAFEQPDEATAAAIQASARARSLSRTRIYQSFMRKTSPEPRTHAEDVRRSRARPRWPTVRTRSEYVANGQQQQQRFDMAGNTNSNLIGMDSDRGRQLYG